jgi:hypothetical protein
MQMKKFMMMITSTVLAVSCLGGGSGGKKKQAACDEDAPEGKIIFVTTNKWDGNLGGLDGADAKCNDRANSPEPTKTHCGGKTYKALVGHTTQRIPNGTGWPLSEDTDYYNLNNQLIKRTNDIATFNPTSNDNQDVIYEELDNPICTTEDQGDLTCEDVWTGIRISRTSPHGVWSVGGNCNNWSSNSASNSTTNGNPRNRFGNWSISNFASSEQSCGGVIGDDYNPMAIYCVQQ